MSDIAVAELVPGVSPGDGEHSLPAHSIPAKSLAAIAAPAGNALVDGPILRTLLRMKMSGEIDEIIQLYIGNSAPAP